MAEEKANYDSNRGVLKLSSIKKMKNLVIQPVTDDYEIEIPEKWVVKKFSKAKVYDDKGNATSDFQIKLNLIDYDVASVMIQNKLTDALDTITGVQVTFPVNQTVDDAIDDKEPYELIISLNNPVIKPLWVSKGNNGGYTSVRLFATGLEIVGNTNE